MKVSVVIPCYYSESMIAKVVSLTRKELIEGGYDYEFILVNDGSTDGTFREIQRLCAEDTNVVGVDCAKNLGQHNAIMAGLHQTHGDLIMLMDDDLQTHPSQCRLLLNAIEATDSDVVFARWTNAQQALWRRLGTRFASWSIRVMTHRAKDANWCNYLVMRCHIRDELVRYKGPYPQIQGLIFRCTDRITSVDVQHFEREQGKSGYTLKTLIKVWATTLNFSMLPLRAASIIGLIIGIAGILGAFAVIVAKLVNPNMPAGWPSTMAVTLTCSGMIMLAMGINGEYIGRLFMTNNNSPQFVPRTIIDNRVSTTAKEAANEKS